MSEPQPTTTHNQSSPSDKNQGFLGKLQIGVSIIVAIFGIYTSWQATIAARNSAEIQLELEKAAQKDQRDQKFVELIQAQLGNLAGEDKTKAAIALISLYNLADENDEKIILFRIAVSGQNDELISTISDLFGDDTSVTNEFHSEINAKLSSVLTRRQKLENLTTEIYDTGEIETSPEKKLLQQLTQEQANVQGWIYLGKVRLGDQTLENDQTIKQDKIPEMGKTIETVTSINLRDGGRKSARIKGIIAPDSILEVQEITKIRIDGSYEAVWAKVSQTSAF